jgi:hypothetical protein
MRSVLAVVVLVALTGSCNTHYGVADISAVPDNPTFNLDVYPLYRDHCLVCHSSPPDRGAPNTFRLDVYDTNNGLLGAMDMAGSAYGDVKSNRMPPTAKEGDGVGPNGQAMLKKWYDNGAPQ